MGQDFLDIQYCCTGLCVHLPEPDEADQARQRQGKDANIFAQYKCTDLSFFPSAAYLVSSVSIYLSSFQYSHYVTG